jgi:hypothetical protein
MTEVQQIAATVSPLETLFVVDSMAGQDAVNAAGFGAALELTGDPYQGRWRCTRRRSLVGKAGHRQAHPVHRRG